MTEGKILNGLFEIDELISVRWFKGEKFGGKLFQRDKTGKEQFRDLVNQLLEKKLLTIFYVINWNQGMPVIYMKIAYGLSGVGRGHTMRASALGSQLIANGHDVNFFSCGDATEPLTTRFGPNRINFLTHTTFYLN